MILDDSEFADDVNVEAVLARDEQIVVRRSQERKRETQKT
jgi:hypothetical protein